ncbi:(S)-acetoin forming diacetyl reductase [Leuconostoc carnosum]|uniref:(S)-acetoin forming diacetyl reductase n=1 Tax=Leuconostoc carnosum TaxID=1252 RepID=UPI00123B0E8F|nr:(S)-acetoin forming diacetyl reductase [Leuconostoc carnosum]KAA8358066.1 (S)-acetoin forming diacetyl reductase [Leuconostoc carnosum]KAA8364397.1 (S)-acetoin forming diacetyl reductase [Leuconostoc carnosum]KAA8381452.1 (S)-acetoin forming diacetyl reductase [Leuconostoc carnosum]
MVKVAIVTGAGQGIGHAIAQRLHKDGFKIGIIDYNSETANAAVAKFPDGDAFAAVADVSKRNQVFDAFDKIVGHFGDLHVVVNNAGVAPTTPLDTITEEQFINTFSINVGGTIWGSQAAHKYFKEFGHGGKIINAASQAGVLGNPNLTIYGGTKFAIRGITQTLARDLAEEGITVTAYAPGIVKTPMMFDIAHQVGKNAGKDDEWGMQTFAKDIALKRLSEPEDVANAVSFLAGPDSNYVTGQTLVVDGGMVFH